MPTVLSRPLKSFAASQEGAASFVMLFVVCVLMVIGGLALDLANRYRAEATLQAAADLAAASGAVRLSENLQLSSPERVAYQTFHTSLGDTNMANAWVRDSFREGRYDDETGEFLLDTGDEPANAVRVTLVRSPVWRNGEPTLLLGLIGVSEWDIRVTSVARIRTVEALPCEDRMLSVQARTKLGGSDLFAGICLDARAELTAAPPPDWFSQNAADLLTGVLTPILTPDVLSGPISLLSVIDARDAIHGLLAETRAIRGDSFDHLDLSPSQSIRVSCPDSGVLRLTGPLQLENLLLISECPVRFDSDVKVSASLIITNLKGLDPRRDHDGIASDARLMNGTSCDQGDGARVYLFASANVAAAVPALGLLAEAVSLSGSDTRSHRGGGLGGALRAGLSATGTARLGDIAGLCLGARAMVSADRVSLH